MDTQASQDRRLRLQATPGIAGVVEVGTAGSVVLLDLLDQWDQAGFPGTVDCLVTQGIPLRVQAHLDTPDSVGYLAILGLAGLDFLEDLGTLDIRDSQQQALERQDTPDSVVSAVIRDSVDYQVIPDTADTLGTADHQRLQ